MIHPFSGGHDNAGRPHINPGTATAAHLGNCRQLGGAEPFEYPRSDWPAKVRLVGPGLWEPPADPPAWLEDVEGPLVLVTCSTLFQNDRRIVEVACEAFAGEPLEVVVTTADVDPSGLKPPPTSGSSASCLIRR